MAKFQSLADLLGVEDPEAEPADKTPAQAHEPMESAESFCRDIIDTVQYRESLLRRILLDKLPPAVEIMLWARGWGTVIDKLEVKDTTALEKMSIEQLEERAMHLIALARRIRQEQKDQAAGSGGVH